MLAKNNAARISAQAVGISMQAVPIQNLEFKLVEMAFAIVSCL